MVQTGADVDAVVAGAGLAGTAAACALTQLGLRVLVVEAGVAHSKCLTGELIHPGGASDLRTLRLLAPLVRASATPISGFAVSRFDGSLCESELLDYAKMAPDGNGLTVDRAVMGQALRAVLTGLPGIDLWTGARVAALRANSRDSITVTVKLQDAERRVSTGLLVAADGRNSLVRRAAGVPSIRGPLSAMLGYTLHGVELPHAGYGHLFVGGPGVVFAYPLHGDRIRMMVDVAGTPVARLSPVAFAPYVRALPAALAEPAEHAVATQAALVGSTQTIAPMAAACGRVVLVGDAAGCCHPLSASGLSFSVRDALCLQQAIKEAQGDTVRASLLYMRLRADAQRARTLLAEILYDVFSARSPASRLLCAGTFRYWRASARGREATMSLLAAQETRLSVLAREYLHCVRHCLPALLETSAGTPSHLGEASMAVAGLVRDTWRYVRSASGQTAGPLS